MSFYFCFIFQTISNQKEFSCPINFILFSFNPSYLPPSSNPSQLIRPTSSCQSQLIRFFHPILPILAHPSHHPLIHPSSSVPPPSYPSQLIRSTILLSILAHPSHHPSSSVLHPLVHFSPSVPPSQLIRPTILLSSCPSQLIRPTICSANISVTKT